MKHSIIITYHKNKDMLFFCLKRLLETTNNDVEILIIGNNANTAELDFEITSPRCQYYKFETNLQYPKAINFGVSKCSGDIITFVDADIFVWNGWYEELLACLLAYPKIGAVSAKLINPQNKRILDFGIMYSRFNAAHTMMGLKYDHPLASYNRKVQTLCSAILMTQKSLFNQVGGLDEEIPYSYTDCDYCLRLKDIGYESWVAANSCAFHKGSTSVNNSKSNFSYYRLDAKGIYGMKDYAKFIYDIEEWFKISSNYAKKKYANLSKKYVLIDLSTMYDRKNYYKMIKSNFDFEFLDIIEQPETIRDCEHIVLYDTISFNYIDLATPILYFVDTFVSLFNNQLWFDLRDISHDLVIDRHGNIVTLSDINSNLC
ncbi:MAG: glycosyltransferase [Clostridia bacterium]|nr:glycosyltransferase [Clostridia bacterium]